ncbi:hypothetical protein OKA05_28435 [Luteolibacter arcticus]|uniref:Uncharacterized protein n=1 Tax=Luteolibacter arcticus TaxID=1581411 RepID=A0ABT3GSN8_9BACT|nr:hypothetical protein [Luteolibacter arcticus]MCW1926513.1 hypothetical protein [Luteolibacter arcticus]
MFLSFLGHFLFSLPALLPLAAFRLLRRPGEMRTANGLILAATIPALIFVYWICTPWGEFSDVFLFWLWAPLLVLSLVWFTAVVVFSVVVGRRDRLRSGD